MKKISFSKLLNTLVRELECFQKLLIHSDTDLKEAPLDQITCSIQRVLTIIAEVKKLKRLTLMDEDFTDFCFLLIHGSDMADYLLAFEPSPEKVRRQARAWKKIASRFKFFLK